jgi:hypothetical protein
LVRQTVQGFVEVLGIAPGANCYEGQQPRINRAVLAVDGVQEAMQLRQGVVQDVAQAVPVGNQPLGGVEPVTRVVIYAGGGVRLLA